MALRAAADNAPAPHPLRVTEMSTPRRAAFAPTMAGVDHRNGMQA